MSDLRRVSIAFATTVLAVLLSTSSVLAAGDFSGGTFYQTGDSPYRLATADIDKDGHIDIVVANCGSSFASVLWNNGDGTFPAPKKLTTGASTCPDGVAFGDFNKDGKLDVAVTEYQAGYVAIFINNGHRTFKSAVTYNTFPALGPIGIAAGDFNGDGKLDLAVGGYSNDTVALLKGKAGGKFAAGSGERSVGHFPLYLLAHDFSGDGKLDVVVANSGGSTLSLLKGKGNGTFATAKTLDVGGAPAGLAMGDIDKDGITDLVTVNGTSDDISLLIGQAGGHFAPQVTFDLEGNVFPSGVAVGDFNNDHKLDVAVAEQYGGLISFFYGNGQGDLVLQATQYDGGFLPVDVQTAKLDADAKADLAVANLGVQGSGVAGVSVLLQH